MIDEKKLIEDLMAYPTTIDNLYNRGIRKGIDIAKDIISHQPKIGEWLPCKAGDTLYRIDVDPNTTDHDIDPYYIDNIVLCDDGDILFKYDSYDGIICDLKSLTKGEPYLDYYKVFLTREEAEKALTDMQGK